MELAKVHATILNRKTPEFFVFFDWIDSPVLRGDAFPDFSKGEKGFPTESEAIEVAKQFAEATGTETCNFRLVVRPSWVELINKEWRLKPR